jgi:hypothetical protein
VKTAFGLFRRASRVCLMSALGSDSDVTLMSPLDDVRVPRHKRSKEIMAQQSVRRGRKNQGFPPCYPSTLTGPVRELPYRLAALIIAASEAGQMAASDHRVRPLQ